MKFTIPKVDYDFLCDSKYNIGKQENPIEGWIMTCTGKNEITYVFRNIYCIEFVLVFHTNEPTFDFIHYKFEYDASLNYYDLKLARILNDLYVDQITDNTDIYKFMQNVCVVAKMFVYIKKNGIDPYTVQDFQDYVEIVAALNHWDFDYNRYVSWLQWNTSLPMQRYWLQDYPSERLKTLFAKNYVNINISTILSEYDITSK